MDPNRPLPDNIWLHGLTVLVVVILINLAQVLAGACAVLQFGFMLLGKARNARIAAFGAGLGHWLSTAARFVAAEDDARPFPWGEWRS